jgi:hypothetical protein
MIDSCLDIFGGRMKSCGRFGWRRVAVQLDGYLLATRS